MAAEPEFSIVLDDASMAGANEGAVGPQKFCSAAHEQVPAVLVEIWAGYFIGTSHADFIRAVCAAAAIAPINKKIIPAAMQVDEGGFNGTMMGQRVHG